MKSAAAILAASTDPGPVASAYKLDISVSTPILTLICCPKALRQASTTARAAKLTIRFIFVSAFRPCGPFCLDTEIVVQLVDICVQFGIGELVDDTPMFHHVVAVRNGGGETEILFHQQNGKALLLERANGLSNLLDNDRGKPFRRLIKQQ